MQTHKNVQLADLLSKYGSSDDRGFQGKLQALEEFSRLSSEVREPFPKPGKFFKHQQLTHRFLTHYNDLLVLSETGTGKTCEIAGFLEMTRQAFLMPDPNIEQEGVAHFSKVFIVVKNDTLKKEMKNQLMCKCTGGVYITENVINAKGEISQKKAVTSVLKNAGYSVITYSKMAKYVYEKTKQVVGGNLPINHPYVIREIQEIFNDSVIWMDEAHNLISNADGGVSEESGLKKEEIYQAIHLILHKAQRIKRILSTATPMINKTSEFGRLMNLILPENGKIPASLNYKGLTLDERLAFFPTLAYESEEVFLSHSREELDAAFRGQFPRDYDFVDVPVEQLEPWLRGKINYIRAADTGANPIYRGVNIDYVHEIGNKEYQSRTIVYPSIMTQFQFDIYMNSVDTDKSVKSVNNGQRQSINAVFPDGKWGSGTEEITEAAGLGGNIIMDVRKTGGEKLFFEGVGDNKRANDNFKRIMGDVRAGNVTQEDVLRNIGKYSTKYETICRNVLAAKGICFVYDEIVAGSGLNYLAACLECLGCQRFEEKSSIFVSSTGQSVKPLCSTSDQMDKRQIRETFTKASGDSPPRFAVLTQDTAERGGEILFEAVNCKENMYGDYIKIVLCSRIGREGININNVVEIDMVSPGWNESNNHQARSRGLRATSHRDLIEELKKSGISVNPTIDVIIYNHVALPPTSNLDEIYRRGTLEPEDFLVRDTSGREKLIIDINAYLTAERKDISIKTVMRKLKQISISCNIHYNRNVRDTDKDYTQTCDYDTCKYKCIDPPTLKSDIISDNFNLLYSEDLIETAKLSILNFIKEVDHFSFQELVDGTYYPRPIHLMFALEEIIREKVEIIDRFGYVCFLMEDRGSFYVSRTYPDQKGDYGMYYYSQGLVAVQEQTLKEMNILNEQIASTEVIEQLQSMDPDSQDFSLILHNLPNIVQVSVLEDVVMRYIKGENTSYINKILNYFYSWFVYSFNRPDTSLREMAREFSRIKSGRKAEGLKKIENIFNKERTKTVIEEKNTPLVFVHILYGQGESMNKFNTISRFNKADGVLRILETDKMEVGWRFIDSNAERQVYNEMIQIRIGAKKAPYEQYVVYGTVDPEGIFRIRDRSRENNDTNDGRSLCRGIVCETYGTLAETYELFYRVGYAPPNYDPYIDVNFIRAEVASGRRSDIWRNIDMSNDDLIRFVYAWEKADGTKSRKCAGLQEYLYQKGLVMNVFPV